MQDKEFYSIGEVSKICNISKKALRFYDEIGLISPDMICDDNSYRYYTRKTLLAVPIVKYYKQMGFKLDEMKESLEGNAYSEIEKAFRKKIEELKELEKKTFEKYTSVKDWYELILEAEMVIENGVTEVAVKYVDTSDYCFMKQEFNYNYMESIINIDFTNYIESINNAITGPVMINFPNFQDRMDGKCDKVNIMQKTITPCCENEIKKFGGCMMAACYHIGAHETINETYQKIMDWAETHGYQCAVESYERYVTDYWTTRKKEDFVTEIMVKIFR